MNEVKRAYKDGYTEGVQALAELDVWLKKQVEVNMTAYMDSGNKYYLGASRAMADVKIYIQQIKEVKE